jgi:hypothetical protein
MSVNSFGTEKAFCSALVNRWRDGKPSSGLIGNKEESKSRLEEIFPTAQ